jgi:hypothetical protein
VLAGASIQSVATDPTGAVLIGLVTSQEQRVTVFRFTAGGAFASLWSVSGEDVTLDGDQPIVAWSEGGTLRITRFDAGGAVVWTRAFAGQAQITAMAVDPSHDVLFGGELVTVMDFGGGVLPTELNPDGGRLNGFVVKLSATGTHVFSRKTGYREVGGIASNSARIVVSSMDRPQYYELHLQAFDATGTPIASTGFDTGFGDRGKAHRVPSARPAGYGGTSRRTGGRRLRRGRISSWCPPSCGHHRT